MMVARHSVIGPSAHVDVQLQTTYLDKGMYSHAVLCTLTALDTDSITLTLFLVQVVFLL